MFRKLLKGLKRAVLLSVILGVLGGLSLYLYVENSIGQHMSEESKTEILTTIEGIPEFPERFYKTYKKYFPEEASNTLWHSIFSSLINKRSYGCPCDDMAYDYQWSLTKKEHRIASRIGGLVLQAFLENEIGAEGCFKYRLKYAEFVNSRGIESLLERHYKKELDHLTEREVIELLVIHELPTYYNPIRNPENLKRRVDAIIKKVNSSEGE